MHQCMHGCMYVCMYVCARTVSPALQDEVVRVRPRDALQLRPREVEVVYGQAHAVPPRMAQQVLHRRGERGLAAALGRGYAHHQRRSSTAPTGCRASRALVALDQTLYVHEGRHIVLPYSRIAPRVLSRAAAAATAHADGGAQVGQEVGPGPPRGERQPRRRPAAQSQPRPQRTDYRTRQPSDVHICTRDW